MQRHTLTHESQQGAVLIPLYIRQLQMEDARLQQQRQTEQAAKAEADRVLNQSRLTPLVDRLRAFIQNLPLQEQFKPRSLEFYRRALKGRQGRAAHPGETGEALRSLGFVRKRGWHEADGGFKAIWVPPNEREKS